MAIQRAPIRAPSRIIVTPVIDHVHADGLVTRGPAFSRSWRGWEQVDGSLRMGGRRGTPAEKMVVAIWGRDESEIDALVQTEDFDATVIPADARAAWDASRTEHPLRGRRVARTEWAAARDELTRPLLSRARGTGDTPRGGPGAGTILSLIFAVGLIETARRTGWSLTDLAALSRDVGVSLGAVLGTASLTDAFAGTVGTQLGGKSVDTGSGTWADVGTNDFTYGGGQALGNTTATPNVCLVSGAGLANDQFAEAVHLDNGGATPYAGIGCRFDTSDNGYLFVETPNETSTVYESTTGTLTSIGTSSTAAQDGDTVEIGAVGTTIYGYVNAALGTSPSDSTHTGGAPCVSGAVNRGVKATFSAGDAAGSSTPIPVFMHHYRQMRVR